ncbi:MAG: hypothetical protein A2Y23_00025 [Clostridiales bacterium GWB2_37_7]|nr:MAG: hypothetical protein A2Y23_00025 [Clostridiales bacterium GWB2_37_7]
MSTKVYEVINSKIMELLKQGTVPWRKSWHAASNYPKNLISKKEYRGINIFLLGCQQYSSSYWLTFKQATEKGGHVRKGEKSTPVIFWKWIDRKDADGADGEESIGNGKVPILRYYNVFNICQVEGIEAPPSPETTMNPFTPIERAEQIIAGMPMRPEIRHGGNACYSPMLDYIKLPEPSAFQSPEEYYSTAFHELAHSTGHASRVGRKGILEPSYFGSHEYSKEELVAEMGAAFLCGHAGIEQEVLENSAAYISGWLKALKNDKKLLVMAAAQAQHASDYILGRQEGEEGSTDDTAA